VLLVGNDGMNTPPAHALSRRGITANVRGFTVYGNYAEDNPSARIIEAIANGRDRCGHRLGTPRRLLRLPRGGGARRHPGAPATRRSRAAMVFDIAMGVRKDDQHFGEEVEAALSCRRADLDALLARYRVPRVDVGLGGTGMQR
jgi:mxaJ protein